MKKIVQGLLLFIAASTPLFGIKLSDRTFMAHRDELAYQAIEWTTNNHYKNDKSAEEAGGTLMVTPFYSQSTNSSDVATLFGIGTTGAIPVSSIPLSGTTNNYLTTLHQGLYSFNVDHCPNCNGSTSGQKPMSGTLALAPQRRAWGAYLGWDQSMSNLFKGLRFRITIPIVNVQAGLRPDDAETLPSIVPTTDGINGSTLKDYFSGKLEKGPSTTSHVNQKKLVRGKISNDLVQVFGLADIDFRLDWNCYNHERFSCTIGGSLQLPAGTTVSNEYLFEPQLGARLHVAAGLNGLLQIKAYEGDGVSVRVDLLGDMKYFFEGTERRIISIYDRTNAVVMPASPYRLIVHNLYSGVQPAANVMSLDHRVKPGFQFDGLLGVSTTWNKWTIDLGYNFYWHQEEKVELRSNTGWSDDQYAFAHNHYSMYANQLGTFVIGGTSFSDSGSGTTTVMHSYDTGTGDYNDPKSPITKHQNIIGANNDPAGTPSRVTTAQKSDDAKFPGAFFSMQGPIQNEGKSTSTLRNRAPSSTTGVDANSTSTQAVRYTVTSDYAVTSAQITHSLVGGASYRFDGQYPVILGLGGLTEFQESNRNSALEGVRLWAKIGIQF